MTTPSRLPTLLAVCGPAGTGKTTLAHRLAAEIGCPVVSRDEIKEGMAHSTPGYQPAISDELAARTLPVFFGVLELLLRARVTVVAEAAYQDPAWRRGLEPLHAACRLRIVHCAVDPGLAAARILRRRTLDPWRQVHADPDPSAVAHYVATYPAFDRLSMDVPAIVVDTADGYRPGLAEIVAFAGQPY